MRLQFTNGLKFDEDWEYDKENNWPDQCDDSNDGSKQSPIEIDPTREDFEMKEMDPFIFVNYNQSPKSGTKLKNIGHTINVMFNFDNTPKIKAGGLYATYHLAEIHLHWGTGKKGYEHWVNGGTSLMEIQLIHIKDGIEETDIMKALDKRDGKTDTLAILSVLVEEQKSENAKLKNLFMAAKNVTKWNDTQAFTGVRLSDLLPRNTDGFYRYNGSLTYPKCDEAVIWTIFKDPLYIQEEQKDLLKDNDVKKNYRSLQELGNRKIMDVETGKRNFSTGSQIVASFLTIGTMMILSKML